MTKKLVAFAGGGSAGHVIPSLTIAGELGRLGVESIFLGRMNSIEKELVGAAGMEFFNIRAQGLRRFFTSRNLVVPFNLLAGVYDSIRIFRARRPNVVFGKGGFVSLPPVIAASVLGIPVVIHESDKSLGLANSIAAPLARTVCTPALIRVPLGVSSEKFVVTGNPIRAMDPETTVKTREGRRIILVFGGSQGARTLNEAVQASLTDLLKMGDVHHVTGVEPDVLGIDGYHQYEYIGTGFTALLRESDVAVCRAGANTLAELVELEIPAVLVPLPARTSRGDQEENALAFADNGCGLIVDDEELSGQTLLRGVTKVLESREQFVQALRQNKITDGTPLIVDEIVRLL